MSIIDARVRLPQDLRPSKTYEAPRRLTEQYDRVLNLTDRLNTGSLSELLEVLASNGIEHAVMHAESEGGEPADALNEALGTVLAEHAHVFKGIGCVDLDAPRPTDLARQVVR